MDRLARVAVLAAMVFALLPAPIAYAAPPEADQTSDPKPAGHPGEWINVDKDWPGADVLKGSSGLVGFQLRISAEGKPLACTTFETSNRSELDFWTCSLMMKHAQFIPAHDATGRPVEGVYRNLVRWYDEGQTHPMPKPGHLTIAYDIATSGKVTDCQVTVDGSLVETVPVNPHAICSNTGPFDPPVDAAGKPVIRHVVIEKSVVTTDRP
jgi:hypothetical protein